jgi:hypothetical protein
VEAPKIEQSEVATRRDTDDQLRAVSYGSFYKIIVIGKDYTVFLYVRVGSAIVLRTESSKQ